MDCMRSFSVDLAVQRGYSTANTDVKTWGVAGNYNWQVIENSLGSNILIQGFKNIDLYGIKLNGSLFTDVGLLDGAIVSDYGFDVSISGSAPRISGIATSTFWPLTLNDNEFIVGKYNNEINFVSPFSGVTAINIGRFQANGIGGESLNSITLDFKFSFTFYYKYEGE